MDSENFGSIVAMTLFFLFSFSLMAATIVATWKVYTKAGQPGWASLIPIYNAYIFLKIAKKPGWWLLLIIIPGINVVFMLLALISVNESFGKSTGFLLGLIFLNPIFLLILGFDDSTYTA